MSQSITKFKRWFWSPKVQDQLRSSTVDIIWLAFTLADGNLLDLVIAFSTGNVSGFTFSGVAFVVTRIFMRAIAFFILKKVKTKFPDLALPRDFATKELKDLTKSELKRAYHSR